jgi:hypothetical protein
VTPEEITQRLQQSLEDQAVAAYFGDHAQSAGLSAAFRDVYRTHNYQPLWIENGQDAPQLDALLGALRQADQEGLAPAAYHLAELGRALAAMAFPDAEKVARLDQWATASYLLYASHLFNGSISPGKLDSNWHVQPKNLPLAQYLTRALDRANVAQSLADLVPRGDSSYALLKLELQRLKSVAREGGWPALAATRILQKKRFGPGSKRTQQHPARDGRPRQHSAASFPILRRPSGRPAQVSAAARAAPNGQGRQSYASGAQRPRGRKNPASNPQPGTHALAPATGGRPVHLGEHPRFQIARGGQPPGDIGGQCSSRQKGA